MSPNGDFNTRRINRQNGRIPVIGCDHEVVRMPKPKQTYKMCRNSVHLCNAARRLRDRSGPKSHSRRCRSNKALFPYLPKPASKEAIIFLLRRSTSASIEAE